MTNKQIKKFILSIFLIIVSALFTILTKIVDVQPIGPENTGVGFARINRFFHEFTGYSEAWHNITDILGYVTIISAFVFALCGLIQLIKRKSLLKVDKSLFVLAGFYILTAATYVLFEVVAINYRPVIFDSGLEASFPSSHTVLAVCFLAGAIAESKRHIKNKGLYSFVSGVCAVLMVLMVIGRLISGVHWFTDIVGGMLISGALVSLYLFVLETVEQWNDLSNESTCFDR